MAYSYFDYEGTDTTIQTDILCVSTEHMYAFEVRYEDNSHVTLGSVALAATFTKNDAGVLCELKTAPSKKIRIIRSTPYDVLMHDFSNGAQFNADSVDEVYEQLLYLCQEIVENQLIISRTSSSGGINQNELKAQLDAAYNLGYSEGETAGNAAGYVKGYAAGETAGNAAGYVKGYAAGEAAGYAAGYAKGYAEGEAAGYAAGSYVKPQADGPKYDEYGRRLYPVSVTYTEYGLDEQGNKTGDNITSYGNAYSYNNYWDDTTRVGSRSNLSETTIAIPTGAVTVNGVIPYTFKGEYNRQVIAELKFHK